MPEVPRLDSFVDARGEIRDLLRDCQLDSVTQITRVKGAVGGNHWHEQSTQWIYIVYGILRVVTHNPGDSHHEDTLYFEGDFFFDPPGQRHAWEARTDLCCLVFTQGPRSGTHYESDTHRLAPAERLIPTD
jgi:uncharacterized RmlC-like cupin family protein